MGETLSNEASTALPTARQNHIDRVRWDLLAAEAGAVVRERLLATTANGEASIVVVPLRASARRVLVVVGATGDGACLRRGPPCFATARVAAFATRSET